MILSWFTFPASWISAIFPSASWLASSSAALFPCVCCDCQRLVARSVLEQPVCT